MLNMENIKEVNCPMCDKRFLKYVSPSENQLSPDVEILVKGTVHISDAVYALCPSCYALMSAASKKYLLTDEVDGVKVIK
jgi:hypothetical protein